MLQASRKVLHSPFCSSMKFLSSRSNASQSKHMVTKVHSANGIRIITLAGPSRNALSLQMMEELISHINFERDDSTLRAIVLKADGPVFSAGHNLKELSSGSDRNFHSTVFQAASNLMLSILTSPVPIIASVHGHAAAAGCQLVAGCDIAVCSQNASFSTPGAQVGIFCSTPGIALARAVPLKIAADMLFTGDTISSTQALEYGLVSRVVPEDKLDEEVSKVTDAIVAKSRAVIELGKKFLYHQIQKDVQSAYSLGADVMVSNLSLADAQEGIRSFIEKRKAQWKHC